MPAYQSIDHVMLRLQDVEPLFDLLSRVFALPVAWPLQRMDFATYAWVHAGNTDLELWAATCNDDLPAQPPLPLVHGFALEPAHPLSEARGHIASAGITSKAPRNFQSANAQGEVVTNFTNSVLLDLSAPGCCIFLCEWDARAAIYPWSEAATPAQRRVQHRQALQASGGGPLGLVGLQSIRLGTPDRSTLLHHWQALSGSQTHPVMLTPEISLELVDAEHLQIEALHFGVRSLARARAFLADQHLLLQQDAGDDGALRVDCAGLAFWLVQAPHECPHPGAPFIPTQE